MTAEGIPPAGPQAHADRGTRAVRRIFDIAPIGRILIWAAEYIDPLLHSLTRGRFGLRVPMPLASMTTTGARSGQPRTTAVLYFNDGHDLILIASNYGRNRHPAWYHNLRAHPTAVLERANRSGTYVAAEVADGAERERLFAMADHVYAGFAAYRTRTAQFGRKIPIMRLRRSD